MPESQDMGAGESDLVVRGGTVVTPEGTELLDVGIRDGRIVQLGGDMTAGRELDATGLIVIPGGVDAHVHLTVPPEPGEQEPVWVDDFWTGSRAAIAGGITTVGNMTFSADGEGMPTAISREMELARAQAAVDWFLHPVLADPGPAAVTDVAALAAQGHTSVKVFLVDPQVAARGPELAAVMRAAGRAGSMIVVHCEDAGLVRQAGQDLVSAGHGAMRYYPQARPAAAEVAAVEHAIALGQETGAPVYVVHLSSADALAACRRARAAGQRVYVETRPLYLHLTSELFEEPDAGKYVGAPPLRERSDLVALWRGLAAGDVDTVCSDHAPWSLAAKLDPALDVTTARQGVADLETLMPMLYSEGVAAGRITLARFVELTSANAAKLFGLHPRKGVIAAGSDADLALWDPAESQTIDGARMQSRAGYSVYDGWQVRGWPRFVISRGKVVLDHGTITARPGQGQWLQRGPVTSR
jgi:dihydropyrimidinase